MSESKALMTVSDVRALAKTVVDSRLFPVKTEAEAFTLMMIAQTENCHPMQAMMRYDIIQGRPAKKSIAMLADFQAAGGKIKWIERSDKAAEAEFSSPALTEPVRVRFTEDDAKRAGLTGKDNYKKYPRRMYSARVVSEGVGIAWAGAQYFHTPEEVQDFDNRPMANVVPLQPHKAIDVQATEIPHDPETGEVAERESSASEPFDGSVEVWTWDKKAVEWISTGHEKKLDQKQLALIHILFKTLGSSEDYRRQRMSELYNKRSSGELSVREASDLIDRLQKAVDQAKAKTERQENRLRETTADLQQSLSERGMGDLGREPGED